MVWSQSWVVNHLSGVSRFLGIIATGNIGDFSDSHLPGVTAPPAGLGGDAQPLAAGLLGHEGELPHGAAPETVEGGCHGNAHRGCPGNQEDEEGEGGRVEMHAGDNK